MGVKADLDAAKRGELLFYNTAEAGALLRCTDNTIRKRVQEGALKPLRSLGRGKRRGYTFARDELLKQS